MEGWSDQDQRGSGTMLIVGVLAALLLFGAAATLVSGYAVAAHGARNAADLAALSGAQVMRDGGDACAAATTIARRNSTSLTRCRVTGEAGDFVVAVTVEVVVNPGVRGLPTHLTQQAWAGVLPQE